MKNNEIFILPKDFGKKRRLANIYIFSALTLIGIVINVMFFRNESLFLDIYSIIMLILLLIINFFGHKIYYAGIFKMCKAL
ncbi:MAG: hypothetical protein LUG24_02970 [Clostridiales bacterium]|nr:hypothetical protein [Clostridiales bacterium]